MRFPGYRRLLFVVVCMVLPCIATAPLRAQWRVRSWNPPPKSLELLPWPESRDGSQLLEHSYPNLCDAYFFWICGGGERAHLEPYRAYPRISGEPRQAERSDLKEQHLSFPESARLEGYGVNYVRIPKPKTNSIVPILGHLFYIRQDAEATDDHVNPCDLYRINPSDKAYKKLRFRKEQVYSFPRNDFVAQWYEGTYKYDWFPNLTTHSLRGHSVIVRSIKRIKNDDATSAAKAEIAVVPPRASREPKESDFRWYSVGDELPISWVCVRRGDDLDNWTVEDLRYYRITNIVPPDSPTINVQPDGGGAPIECKPIGWVDIDIHGRKEPEKKAGSP